MNINDAFPSKYIKSDDLANSRVTLKVMSVTMEDIGDKEFKPVMRFFNKDKGMVLNKTNANACMAIWGPETEAWAGQALELFASPVMFQGRQVMGLQVAPILQPRQGQAAPPAQPQGQQWGTPDHAPHNQHTHTVEGSPAGRVLEQLADDIAGAEQQANQPDLDDIPF